MTSNPTDGTTADADAGSASGETESFAGTSPAPEFPGGLDWLNTSTALTMGDLRGKVVLLDFWTYGCINCIHILPDLERLEDEFADALVVIGVHSAKFANESDTGNIEQVILRYDIGHPVVNDRDFEIWRAWGANAWPTTVLVDPAGNVVGAHSGEGVYQVVEPVVRSLVAEFDASGQLDRAPFETTLLSDGQPQRVLSFPGKVEVAAGDGRIFVADTGHNRIVAADRDTGAVTAVYGDGTAGFTDGRGLGARFAAPQGMALDGSTGVLYVADTGNHAIRAVDTASGEVSTVLGTGELGWPPVGGTAPDVAISSPWDVLVDGDRLFIAMAGHHQIWEMDVTSGAAAPLVGSSREGVLNGALDEAELAQPSGLAIADGTLYFADSESSSIRSADVVAPAGRTRLIAGGSEDLFTFGDEDGIGDSARLQHPLGVAVWNDSLVVADTYNSKLKLIDPVTLTTSTFLGSSQGWADGDDPLFHEPGGVAVDGDTLFVADTNNHVVRKVDLTTGETTTLVLSGIEAFTPPPGTDDAAGTVIDLGEIALAPAGRIVVDVALPDGYEVNAEAPSSLIIDGPLVFEDGSTAVDLTGTTLPVDIPVGLTGDGPLSADLTLMYCEKTAESLCLIDQVRFVAAVSAGDAVEVELRHEVAAPPSG